MCCPSTIAAHALVPSSADSSLWLLSEIEEALAMAGTGSSESSVRTPCPGVENESEA